MSVMPVECVSRHRNRGILHTSKLRGVWSSILLFKALNYLTYIHVANCNSHEIYLLQIRQIYCQQWAADKDEFFEGWRSRPIDKTAKSDWNGCQVLVILIQELLHLSKYLQQAYRQPTPWQHGSKSRPPSAREEEEGGGCNGCLNQKKCKCFGP